MIIKEAVQENLQAWIAMRSKLWPCSNDHGKELLEYFEGRSIDIEQAFILHADGAAIGFIELNIRDFAEGSRQPKVPYVEGWFVEESYRGSGLGAKLMLKAEEWALKNGFNELASDTELTNTKSIEIHGKLGFVETERVVCFIKRLK